MATRADYGGKRVVLAGRLVDGEKAEVACAGFAKSDSVGIGVRDAWLKYAAAWESDEGTGHRFWLAVRDDEIERETDVFLPAALGRRGHRSARGDVLRREHSRICVRRVHDVEAASRPLKASPPRDTGLKAGARRREHEI